jgi:hypothetical protein
MSTAATAVGVLRHASISWSQAGAAAPLLTAPIIALQKYTFNVAHSGTTLNIVSVNTSTTTASANLRSAPTGATVTAVGNVAQITLPALNSSVGVYGGSATLYEIAEHYNRGSAVEFGPGEGIAVLQITSGTTLDTRVFSMRLVWDELDVA